MKWLATLTLKKGHVVDDLGDVSDVPETAGYLTCSWADTSKQGLDNKVLFS